MVFVYERPEKSLYILWCFFQFLKGLEKILEVLGLIFKESEIISESLQFVFGKIGCVIFEKTGKNLGIYGVLFLKKFERISGASGIYCKSVRISELFFCSWKN